MGRPKKRRLIELLKSAFPSYSQEELLARIFCKNVLVNGGVCTNHQELFDENVDIQLSYSQYVSRGGVKLAHALDNWNIDVSNLVMLDAGSSTGGFTDCLLQKGAKSVHSVDVGYNQLDYRLRIDDRVIVHEKQNIMKIMSLTPSVDAAVADLSFRSITGAASHILSLTKEKWMISLIKPQFELDTSQVEFTGVIADKEILFSVLQHVYDHLLLEGVGITAIIRSPILGRKGNIEFLAMLQNDSVMDKNTYIDLIKAIIQSDSPPLI